MTHESDSDHTLKNHMAIILGYADLLLEGLPPGDPHREDVVEIRKAAIAAAEVLDRRAKEST
jgi:hypothetical protein